MKHIEMRRQNRMMSIHIDELYIEILSKLIESVDLLHLFWEEA